MGRSAACVCIVLGSSAFGLSAFAPAYAQSEPPFQEEVLIDSLATRVDSSEVVALWERTAAAIHAGDTTRARSFVAAKWRGTGLARTLLQLQANSTFQLAGVERFSTYARITVDIGPSGHTTPQSFYVVNDRGRPAFAPRWAAMTVDWAERIEPGFIFRYDPFRDSVQAGVAIPTDLSVSLLERHRAWLENLLGVSAPAPSTIYLVNSLDEMRDIFGHAAPNGFMHTPSNAIVTIFPHGVFSQIAMSALLKASGTGKGGTGPNRFLVWGFGTYGDGNGGVVDGSSLVLAVRTLIAGGQYRSLSQAIASPDTHNATVEAGCLLKYLVEEYGAAKFRSLVQRARTESDFIPALESVYGMPIDSLDRAFRAWVGRYAASPFDLSDTVVFRILTDSWDIQRIGPALVHVDMGMPFPSVAALGRMMSLYRMRSVSHPLSSPDIYLASSPARLAELGVTGSAYAGGRILIGTSVESIEAALRSRIDVR